MITINGISIYISACLSTHHLCINHLSTSTYLCIIFLPIVFHSCISFSIHHINVNHAPISIFIYHLSSCLSVFLSINLSFVYLSVCLTACLSICLSLPIIYIYHITICGQGRMQQKIFEIYYLGLEKYFSLKLFCSLHGSNRYS